MTFKNKKKIQFLSSPLICMNKAPRLVNRGRRCYLRLQPHYDDDDDYENCDGDDYCNDDDMGNDDDNCDDGDGFNFQRVLLLSGSACSSFNKTTQSRKEESLLHIAV